MYVLFNLLTLRYSVDRNLQEFSLLPYKFTEETEAEGPFELVLVLTADQELELQCKNANHETYLIANLSLKNIYSQSTDNIGDNDVAILKLSNPLKFNSFVKPACLPPDESFYPENEGKTNAIASGWGHLKDRKGVFFNHVRGKG